MLSGRYRLLDVLGDGGMARVYRAEDERLHRIVAVKTLHRQYLSQPEFIRRFEQEAQLAANLTHPNIVAIYDVGRDGDAYYIVMEYVEGRSLKALIAREAPLPLDRAVPIMRQLGLALDAAHAHGVIHRDIKPENILLTPANEVKVGDFGIARALTGAAHTATGMVLGSVSYFAPEQAQGRPATAESDIYSSGIVLYEMLTGRLPFVADNPLATAMQQITQPPAPPRALVPALPPGVDAVVLKALAKNPEARFHSGAALADALSAAAVLRDAVPAAVAPSRQGAPGHGRIQPAPTVRVAPVAARPARRSALVPFLLLVLFGGGAVYAMMSGDVGRLLGAPASATPTDTATAPAATTPAAATAATTGPGGAGSGVATATTTPTIAVPAATATTGRSTSTPHPSATATPTHSHHSSGNSGASATGADIATGRGGGHPVQYANGIFSPLVPRNTFAPSEEAAATFNLHNPPAHARIGAVWTFPNGKQVRFPCATCGSPPAGSTHYSYWVEQLLDGPGSYTVAALVNGHVVGSHHFTVGATGAASPTGTAAAPPTSTTVQQAPLGNVASNKPGHGDKGRGHGHQKHGGNDDAAFAIG